MMNDPHGEPTRACPSNLVFDKLRAGELATGQARALGAHVQECALCSARQHRLDVATAAYLTSPEARNTLQQLVHARATPRTLARRLALAGAATAAALALLAWWPHAANEAVRLKGGPQLGFFVKRGARVFRGSDGERVHPGDLLRFTARLARPAYLAIFGIDQRGVVSLYHPVLGASARLEPAHAELALPASIELDDVLGEEQVVGLFCEQLLEISSLQRQLSATRGSDPPPGCQLETLVLHKEQGSR